MRILRVLCILLCRVRSGFLSRLRLVAPIDGFEILVGCLLLLLVLVRRLVRGVLLRMRLHLLRLFIGVVEKHIAQSEGEHQGDERSAYDFPADAIDWFVPAAAELHVTRLFAFRVRRAFLVPQETSEKAFRLASLVVVPFGLAAPEVSADVLKLALQLLHIHMRRLTSCA